MSRKRALDEGGVYTRTRKRKKAMEYHGTATIQDLPVEVVWKIIDYLDPDCFLNLRSICLTFSKTLTVVFYHYYKTISYKMRTARNDLNDKLFASSLEQEEERLDVAKSLLYLEWLSVELVLMKAILWRYRVDAESKLFPMLWPIMKEMVGRLSSLTSSVPFVDIMPDIRVLNPTSSLPLWSKFIDEFDQDLEPTLGKSFPFETKVVDILSCCPTANVRVYLKKSAENHTVDLKAFFQIQDSCSDRLKLTDLSSDPDYEKSILRLLRFIVRTRNSLFTNNVFDDFRTLECRILSQFINPIDRNSVILLLVDMYRQLDSPMYMPLILLQNNNGFKCYTRESTFNVSNNFLECSLVKKSLNPDEVPLIVKYPHLFGVEKMDWESSDDLMTSSLMNQNSSDFQLIEESEPPFKLRIFFKKFWEDISIMVNKNLHGESLSKTSYVLTEEVQRINTDNRR